MHRHRPAAPKAAPSIAETPVPLSPDAPLNGHHVVVVGAGPSGALAAILMARRGYTVAIYERCSDPASAPPEITHSYPMVLSARALKPLSDLQLNMPAGRPWENTYKGGFDLLSGKINLLSDFDPMNECIRSFMVERATFSRDLIREARARFPTRITFHFDSPLLSLDVAARSATFAAPPAGAHHSSAAAAAAVPAAAAAGHAGPAGGRSSRGRGLDGGRTVPYDLLLAADGANSATRGALQGQLPSFRVHNTLQARDKYITFRRLPALAPGEGGHAAALPAHAPRTHLYSFFLRGKQPRVIMWRDESGDLNGVVACLTKWDTASARDELRSTFGNALPGSWLDSILAQADGQTPSTFGRIVHCDRFDAPRVVLLGDAAHPMTGTLGQGGTAAIESVGVWDRVLGACRDDLDAAPAAFTAARRVDAHAMQAMEFMTVTMFSKHLEFGSRLASLSAIVARSSMMAAMLTSTALHKVLPQQFKSPFYAASAMRDLRTPYRAVLRALRLQAAVAVLAAAAALWGAARLVLQVVAWKFGG